MRYVPSICARKQLLSLPHPPPHHHYQHLLLLMIIILLLRCCWCWRRRWWWQWWSSYYFDDHTFIIYITSTYLVFDYYIFNFKFYYLSNSNLIYNICEDYDSLVYHHFGQSYICHSIQLWRIGSYFPWPVRNMIREE